MALPSLQQQGLSLMHELGCEANSCAVARLSCCETVTAVGESRLSTEQLFLFPLWLIWAGALIPDSLFLLFYADVSFDIQVLLREFR